MNETTGHSSSQINKLQEAGNDELKRKLWELQGNIGILELEVELIEEELKRRGIY